SMTGAHSRGTAFRFLLKTLGPAVALALLAASCSRESAAARQLKEATAFYDQGKYAEALPLFEKARDGGLKDGILLYKLGYCRGAVDGRPEGRGEIWKTAEPLLVQEIGKPAGATLERLYGLAVIYSDRKEWDKMKQYAGQAVEQYEKGPNPNSLTGEDWFRLGRLHDFLIETSEAEAAYRRAVSSFSRSQGGSTTYRSLALSKVAEFDMKMARYTLAASEFDEALKLFPGNTQVQPFLHGLALVAAQRYDDAIARFRA